MRTKKNQRTDAEKELHRAEIAKMYLEGWYQSDIAAKLGISQPQVSYDLKVLHDRWRAEGIKRIGEYISRELVRIDRLEQMYFDAWERSTQPADSYADKYSDDGVETTFKLEERDGSPQFLVGVQWCIKRRCDLLGLDAPKRTLNVNSDDPNDFNSRLQATSGWVEEEDGDG
jgi:hypothetical protein